MSLATLKGGGGGGTSGNGWSAFDGNVSVVLLLLLSVMARHTASMLVLATPHNSSQDLVAFCASRRFSVGCGHTFGVIFQDVETPVLLLRSAVFCDDTTQTTFMSGRVCEASCLLFPCRSLQAFDIAHARSAVTNTFQPSLTMLTQSPATAPTAVTPLPVTRSSEAPPAGVAPVAAPGTTSAPVAPGPSVSPAVAPTPPPVRF